MAPSLGGHEMLGLYGEGISKMPENPGIPPLFRDIFKNAYIPYRDPETLKAFLKIIDEFSYDHSERLGDAVVQSGRAAAASDRAKGPPPYQPRATPQETGAKNGKGLKARPISRTADESGLQPSEMLGNRELGRCPRLVWNAPLARRRSALMARLISAQHRPGNDAPDNMEGLKARFTTGLIGAKEKIAANGDYNLSGERYREVRANAASVRRVRLGDLCKRIMKSTHFSPKSSEK